MLDILLLRYPKEVTYEEVLEKLSDNHPLKRDYQIFKEKVGSVYGYLHRFFLPRQVSSEHLRKLIGELFLFQLNTNDKITYLIRQLSFYSRLEVNEDLPFIAGVGVIFLTIPRIEINRRLLLNYLLAIPEELFEPVKVKETVRYFVAHEFLHISDLHILDMMTPYRKPVEAMLRNIAGDIRVSALYEHFTKNNLFKSIYFKETRYKLIHWSQFYQNIEIVLKKNIDQIYEDLKKLLQHQKKNRHQELPPELRERGLKRKVQVNLPSMLSNEMIGKIDAIPSNSRISKRIAKQIEDILSEKSIGRGILEVLQKIENIGKGINLAHQLRSRTIMTARQAVIGKPYSFFRNIPKFLRAFKGVIPPITATFNSSFLVLVDTSGSISKEELEFFLRIIKGTFDAIPLALFCDGIYDIVRLYNTKKLKELEFRTGGTFLDEKDLKKLARQFPPTHCSYLILTDGLIEFESRDVIEYLNKINALFMVTTKQGEKHLKEKGCKNVKYLPLKKAMEVTGE